MTTIKKGAVVVRPSGQVDLVLVDPVGGLELNSSNELKIKRDGGIQTTADGTSVIDCVKTAGNTMTGDLLLSNDASGPDTVRRLGCLDLGEGKAFSITVGNIENQLQLANIAQGQTQTPLTAETTHGFAVNVASTRELEVGEGFTKISSHLIMSEKRVSFVADPAADQDVAIKKYVDARKLLITVWAEEKGSITNGNYEWSFGNGGDGEAHRRIGYTMMASGRVLRMGLSATTSSGPPGESRIVIVVNGVVNAAYAVIKPGGQYSGTNIFQTPLEVSEGDSLRRVN